MLARMATTFRQQPKCSNEKPQWCQSIQQLSYEHVYGPLR
jgi:hypothetical protein